MMFGETPRRIRHGTDASRARLCESRLVRSDDKRWALSREELDVLAREYHHLLEEHRRARPESRVRRHMEKSLRELESRLEHVLAEWVSDEELRSEWRAHLYGDAPEPSRPAAERPLVFRGRADTGSVVEVRGRTNGDCDVELDGHRVERLEELRDLPGEEAPERFTFDGLVFQEVFSVSELALAALADFVAEREPHPPWRFAAQLMADGLIDRNFGLTHRGRRALGRAQGR